MIKKTEIEKRSAQTKHSRAMDGRIVLGTTSTRTSRNIIPFGCVKDGLLRVLNDPKINHSQNDGLRTVHDRIFFSYA